MSSDQDQEAYSRFLARHHVDLLTVRDPAEQAARLYHSSMWPETYIIDPQGIIRRSLRRAGLEQPGDSCLSEEPVDSCYDCPMTTVEILFHYATQPTESVTVALAGAREVYGIRRLNFDALPARCEWSMTPPGSTPQPSPI